jgi:hypothetical protein
MRKREIEGEPQARAEHPARCDGDEFSPAHP